MRSSSFFIFIAAKIGHSRDRAVASAANLFEEADIVAGEGGGIDYLEITSHYLYLDDNVGSLIDDGETNSSSFIPVEADGGGAYDDSGVDGVGDMALGDLSNIFTDSPVEAAAGIMGTDMLDKKIICGYQGWFGFPGDGAPIKRWRHWFRVNGTAPPYEDVTVDMYPTIDEYDVGDVMESGVKMPDGMNAKFFSSARPNVVLKHFQWMATYGISGVFHHRFMTNWNTALHETRTIVLRNVRRAAEATGRVFAVSYDLAGSDNEVLEKLKTDWMDLVDKEGITSSSQYILQKGLPVLHIYGIGFTHISVDDTTRMKNLIDWLTSTDAGKYRVFLIGGLPGRWRDQVGDSRPGTAWKNIYDSLDGIHPWHVGRWIDEATFDTYYSSYIADDAKYCKDKGIQYMPTMWPGFSWHNLKSQSVPRPAINAIPRQGGNFMWRQAYKYAANNDIKSIFCAQFDEVDEGTAIFKVTAGKSDLPLPVGGWLGLDADGDNLPSDWYLRLTGEAQLMLERSRPLTSTLPLTQMPTSKPTLRPTAYPTTRIPSAEPTTRMPTAKPSTSKPTSKPTTAKPTTRMPTAMPSSARPTSKPSSSNPTSKPTTVKPTTRMPTAKPTTQMPTAKPSSARPSSKPSSSKPTSNPTTVKPTTRMPTAKAIK